MTDDEFVYDLDLRGLTPEDVDRITLLASRTGRTHVEVIREAIHEAFIALTESQTERLVMQRTARREQAAARRAGRGQA